MKQIILFAIFLLLFSAFDSQKQTVLSADPEPENMKGMTARHNFYRRQVGLGDLVWSNELAQYAQAWANELKRRGCEFEHRPYEGKWEQKYGENIYMSSGMKNKPENVADNWASEKDFFDYKTCDYENFTCNGEAVGHYTQMVWKKTQRVGCAMVRCGDEEIWVCNYDPAGNYMGEKPY